MSLVFFLMAAFGAFMQDYIFSILHFNSDRSHQPAAAGLPVAGIDVDMPRPQANRAMVGITIPLNLKSAIPTNKILNCPLESFHSIPKSPLKINGLFVIFEYISQSTIENRQSP
jgi:hypothetical protein